MLISFGYYGMNKSWNLFPRLVLTIVIIVVAVYLWSIYAAPKSTRRLEMPYLAVFRASMFLIASFLLFRSGQKSIALVFVGLTIVTQIASYITEK